MSRLYQVKGGTFFETQCSIPVTIYVIASDLKKSFVFDTRLKLDCCIVWNAHNTALGSKRLAICATV